MNKNIIPVMTHPLSRGWEQPSTENILIDDTHAIMSKEDFSKLAEYSTSRPTGVYEGKIWKRNLYEGSLRSGYKFSDVWTLCWYGYSYNGNPEQCSINEREIILL